MSGEAGIVRVDDELAEEPAERDLLRDRQVLIAKEDDLVRRQRSTNRLELDGLQSLSQIDAEDLRADGRRQRVDRERGAVHCVGC
jgi:hypothetical protein